MTVYVDALTTYGPDWYRGASAAQAKRTGAKHGHRWCHLFADEADCEELHAMASRIGMRREWFQGDHYDLVPPRRSAAVRLGAVELDRSQSVAVWNEQKARAAAKWLRSRGWSVEPPPPGAS